MLVYANHLQFQGASSKDVIIKAIGGWLKEQLGYGLRPAQLLAEGDYTGRKVHPKTKVASPSWLKVYATAEAEPELYAWVLKNSDGTVFGRTWITTLGFKRSGNFCEVSCVVRTDETSIHVTSPVSASRPRVVGYIASNIADAVDADFSIATTGLSPKFLGSNRDAYRALLYEIERIDRDYPLVLVSPTWDGEYLFNINHLQSSLLGLAQVVVIQPDFDRYELEEVLGRKWAAWNGALNVLRAPSASGSVWNRLFVADQILGWGEAQHLKVAEVLGWITNSTNVGQLRRRIRPEGVMQLAIKRRLKNVQDNSSLMSIEELRGEVVRLTKDLADQTSLQEMFEEDNVKLQGENESIKQALLGLEDKIGMMDHENAALKSALERSGGNVETKIDVDKLLTLACATGEIDPIECLEIVEMLFSGQCIVLESARQSALETGKFRKGRTLLDMLRRLVTEYRTGLLSGGDTVARQVFGKNEYAAKESETVMNNPAMRRARTFKYEESDVEMYRHLKLGVDSNEEKTIRVHFHWDANKEKIVIGYCGQHLPIATH